MTKPDIRVKVLSRKNFQESLIVICWHRAKWSCEISVPVEKLIIFRNLGVTFAHEIIPVNRFLRILNPWKVLRN